MVDETPHVLAGVEVGADPIKSAAPQTGIKNIVEGKAAQGVYRFGPFGEKTGGFMRHGLRDASDATGDNGHAGGHGFGNDVGKAGAVTISGNNSGEEKNIRPTESFKDPINGLVTFKAHPVAKLKRLDPAGDIVPPGTVAKETGLKSKSGGTGRAKDLDEVVITHFFNKAPHRQYPQRHTLRAHGTHGGKIDETAADDKDPFSGQAEGLQPPPARHRGGADKPCPRRLFREKPIAASFVEVIGMRSEAVGQTREALQKPRGGGGKARPNGMGMAVAST